MTEGNEGRNIESRCRYDLATRQADYPDWNEERPRRSVLICTHLRSGSTLLGEAMVAAGGQGCPIEYFHKGFESRLAEMWDATDLSAYVRAVYGHRTDPTGTLGVKLFWCDLVELCIRLFPYEYANLNQQLNDPPSAPETYLKIHTVVSDLFPKPTFVYLRRRDSLRQAVSHSIAVQSQIWRSIPHVEENAPVREPIYDFGQILDMFRFASYCHAHWEGYFQATGTKPHHVAYEELLSDYSGTIAGLYDVLGVSTDSPVPPRMQKQADSRSEQFAHQFLRDYTAGRHLENCPSGDGTPMPAPPQL